ncbi:UNKNOWN [Stylonychia lemnae]|uniref:Transmembrane protein n=1 Tax=Stylonychia lemnae TaxID=5949 RepID=A0A078A069_STYLE|nr:UNKNOWN [Stylonychia lemnae]|eukprot:CDW75545.1 UNKNOWN [Stylonychia lemnae]
MTTILHKLKEFGLNCLRFITLGKIYPGLYYEKRSYYISWISTILTIFGLAILVYFSVLVLIDIFQCKVKSVKFQADQDKQKLRVDQSTEEQLSIPQTNDECGGYKCQFTQPFSNVTIKSICQKNIIDNFGWYFDIRPDLEDAKKATQDNNLYFDYGLSYQCNCQLQSSCFDNKYSDDALYYYKSYYYDNQGSMQGIIDIKNIDSLNRSRLVMQMNYYMINETDSVTNINPTFSLDYYFTVKHIQIQNNYGEDGQFVFEFEQDENSQIFGYLFAITVIPQNILYGLAQIGGYLSLFGAYTILLQTINRWSLKNSFKSNITMTNMKTQTIEKKANISVSEVISIEKFYEMQIEMKELRMSLIELKKSKEDYKQEENKDYQNDDQSQLLRNSNIDNQSVNQINKTQDLASSHRQSMFT